MVFDLILTCVNAFDETGRVTRDPCDIGVVGDRIVGVGDLSASDAARRIDCRGLTALPGFIDVHTHADFEMFRHPARDMAVSQGVTTEIISACGIGAVPLCGDTLRDYNRLMHSLMGDVPEQADFSSVNGFFGSMPETGVNVAMQLAHSPLRIAVTGGVRDVALNDDAWKKLEKLEREAFEQGAVSLSTGMSYYPATFSDTEELVRMCRIAREYQAPLSVHQRSEFRSPDAVFDSKREILQIARQSGASLVFSHYRTYPGIDGCHVERCEIIEEGIAEGLSLFADFYPYAWGCSYAPISFPMWAMDGGYGGLLGVLKDPSTRARLSAELEERTGGRWDGMFSHAQGHPELLGRLFSEVASETKETRVELILRLLEACDLSLADVGGREVDPGTDLRLKQDFAYFMQRPYYSVGSDTLPMQDFPHPRSYGAFAEAVNIAVTHGVPMPDLARATSGLAARLYQLRDRGRIAPGYFADLVVFDPKTVRATATYTDPKRFCEGVPYVTVNGRLAKDGGKLTGVRSGRPLRRAL